MPVDIRGLCKQAIMDDIFGRTIGNVFESGLSDAGSTEEVIGLLESLEEKWSSRHQNGKASDSWLGLNKKEDFIRSVLDWDWHGGCVKYV